MTDRLLMALLLMAIAVVAGIAIRQLAGTRTRQIAATAALSAATAPRLLLFTSKWCGDCIAQRDVIARLRESWPHPVEISYHDAVHEGEFARRFGIMMVPAVVVAGRDGTVIGVKQGLVDEDRLRSLIEAAA